jgi:hypothetical protein
VPTYSAPLFPELDVPVLNIIMPLIPAAPAFDVLITIVPLLDTVLYPLSNDTRPPVIDDDKPPDTYISPPIPLSPLPTTMDTDPPRPDIVLPVPSVNEPLLPLVDVPDPTLIEPLPPELALPVLRINTPLCPLCPAFEVAIKIDPLDVFVPYPLVIDTLPPLDDPDVPDDTVMSPPVPLLPDPTVM